MDFDKDTQGLLINTKEKGNISNLLKEFVIANNTTLISKSFTQLALGKLNFSEVSEHQFTFISKQENSYIKNYAVLKINVSVDDSTKIGRLGIVITESDINLKNFTPFRDAVHQVFMNNTKYSWVYYGLPKGSYAIAAAQDINNNRKPDFASEKYAFSKDARVAGDKIPTFDECKLEIIDNYHVVQLVLKARE